MRRLVVYDVVAISLAVAAALTWRFWLPNPFATGLNIFRHIGLGAILVVAWVTALGLARTRSRHTVGVGIKEYQRVIMSSLWVFGLVAIGSYVFQVQLSRALVIVALPIGVFLVLVGRWAARRGLHRRRQIKGEDLTPTVVVGDVHEVRRMLDDLVKVFGAGYQPIAVCVTNDPNGHEDWDDLQVLTPEQLEDSATVESFGAIIVLKGLSGIRLRRLSWLLEGKSAELLVQPAFTDVAGTRLIAHAAEGLSLMHLDMPRYAGWQVLVKRLFDIAFSTLALICLSPILLVIAICIKIDDPKGPIIFRQDRAGYQGKVFKIHKFRTMCVDAEAKQAALEQHNQAEGPLFKIDDDPRITRVGRVLRKYSLDELPQFWDSLMGSISVVGPRPHPLRDVAQYSDVDKRRLLAKPGITGPWQVMGRSDLTWDESIRLDLRYVENWSLIGDIVIIVKTVFVMLRGSGAY
ncbi:MAG: sugar transferase [Propionibacteriaceae bacterium]|nr:sugar transferase [Propionibacteriaceae bacterium]